MSTATFESLWASYHPIVDGLARQFGKGHRSYGAEEDDFRQEAMAWMYSKIKDEDVFDEEGRKTGEKRPGLLIRKYEELEGDPRFEKWLYRCIENEFRDYAIDIKDQAGGQPRQGAYFYSVGELKALLPSVLDKSKWLEPPQSEGKGSGIPAEGGNWIATMADVARAFDRLRPQDRDLLWEIHMIGTSNKALAQSNGVTEAAQTQRHNAALRRLLNLLGGERPRHMRPDNPHDPWRGRRAVSNRQARAITSSAYDGEG